MLEARPRRGPGVREETGQSRWFCGPNPGSRATSATRATGSRRSATFQSPKVERYREAMPNGDVLNWEAVAWAAAAKDSEPPLGEAKSHLAVSDGLPARLHRTSAGLGHLAKSKEHPVNPLPWGEPPGLRAGIRAGLFLVPVSNPQDQPDTQSRPYFRSRPFHWKAQFGRERKPAPERTNQSHASPLQSNRSERRPSRALHRRGPTDTHLQSNGRHGPHQT